MSDISLIARDVLRRMPVPGLGEAQYIVQAVLSDPDLVEHFDDLTFADLRDSALVKDVLVRVAAIQFEAHKCFSLAKLYLYDAFIGYYGDLLELALTLDVGEAHNAAVIESLEEKLTELAAERRSTDYNLQDAFADESERDSAYLAAADEFESNVVVVVKHIVLQTVRRVLEADVVLPASDLHPA